MIAVFKTKTGEINTMPKNIVPLNLVMSYPVYWGKYEILRDFIQNFYDSVGYGNWEKAFKYQYQRGELTCWLEGITFNYEWLMHIGASTKTANSHNNAGYFGEGFKIASLCALRDYKWNINMSSGDWTLSVIKIQHKIDDKIVNMLAYDVDKTDFKNLSKLTLSYLKKEDFSLFKVVLKSFYYPQNPFLGEKIWEGTYGAVYTRGKEKYDEDLPYTQEYGRKGTVFCGYQLLGSNPFDLSVCLHLYKKEDRERKSLYSFYVIDVFKDIARYIDAKGAMLMLEKMRRNWNSTPKEAIDIHTWYPVINKLIWNISSSKEITKLFKAKYPNLLYLPYINNISEKNRRGQARAWLSSQIKKYVIVQENFQELGYPSLEEECEKDGGFTDSDFPNEIEKECFSLLERLIEKIYAGFFYYKNGFPQRKIIRNLYASYHGMAKTHRTRENLINIKGIKFRYDVGEIYLKANIFKKDGYYDAIATYVHEFCHSFGSDGSESFSLGLTFAMEILITNNKKIEHFKKQWEKIFE